MPLIAALTFVFGFIFISADPEGVRSNLNTSEPVGVTPSGLFAAGTFKNPGLTFALAVKLIGVVIL